VIPVSWSLDTLGAITRTVQDARLLADVLTAERPDRLAWDMVDPTPDGRPPTIGVLSNYFFDVCTADVRTNARTAVESLSSSGAVIREIRVDADFRLLRRIQMVIDHVESAAFHRRQFAARAIDYGPDIGRRVRVGAAIPAVDYVDAQRVRASVTAEFLSLFGSADALMTPSVPAAAPLGLSSTGDPSFQSPWTLVGFPAITLPSGLDSDDLPLGIQLIGRPDHDRDLLAVALWCEGVLGRLPLPPAGTRT
jgi:aspartyl-tRNA(Asn)/glutamyl-tRNA(Gln) amidotransferase subunit A